MHARGNIFDFAHQTASPTKIINCLFDNILSQGILLDAGDKQKIENPLSLLFINSRVSNTNNKESSFLNVQENSKLTVQNSTFINNFSTLKGAVICGNY